jgi:hypothetical protein
MRAWVDTIGSGQATRPIVSTDVRIRPPDRHDRLRPDNYGPPSRPRCAIHPQADTIGSGQTTTDRHVDRGARSAPQGDTIGFRAAASAHRVDRRVGYVPRVDTIGSNQTTTTHRVDQGAGSAPQADTIGSGQTATAHRVDQGAGYAPRPTRSAPARQLRPIVSIKARDALPGRHRRLDTTHDGGALRAPIARQRRWPGRASRPTR